MIKCAVWMLNSNNETDVWSHFCSLLWSKSPGLPNQYDTEINNNFILDANIET